MKYERLKKSDLIAIITEQNDTIETITAENETLKETINKDSKAGYIEAVVEDMSEFNQSNILRDMAWSATNKINFNNKKISEVVSQLRVALASFNGSEVQDEMIGRKREFIESLEEQREQLEAHKKSVLVAYRSVTGSDYTPPPQRSTFDKTKTANALSAEGLLVRYS